MSDKTNVNLLNVEKINGLQTEAKLQAEVIGGLRQKVVSLEREAINEKKKITLTINKPQRDSWGDLRIQQASVQKVNVDEAGEIIAKHVNEDNEEQIALLKKQVKQKKAELETMEDHRNQLTKQHQRTIEGYREEYKEKTFQASKSLNESNTKLKHQVVDLKEELVKVRSDKTDAAVEQERKEEVGKLKARVKTLEREIKRLSTQGWIGKLKDRWSNRGARVEALKQQADERAAAPATPIRSTGPGLFGLHLPYPWNI